MPSIGFMALKARDDDVPFGFVREDNEIIPWRYSKQAFIVKWSIMAGVVVLILLFLLTSWLHLRSRVKKGLPPLRYHRFLVRTPRQPAAAQQTNGWVPQTNNPMGGYYMGTTAPPPVYDPAKFPMYSGHTDPEKVDYAREPTRREAEANPAPDYYDIPLGPPPAAATR
ncbi:uncharacterized protein TrAFT101_005754 [Trichoderma asperellum]|uniref:Uncharacterized protein n=1 Tax=Trichoderma asperellum (strain ATCC 204424 / CBS 433.97 / NBRC 101777) TaxID=1042311 RepID=A0A2T3Z6Z1_TRIA4|nr:hypothetical protein M441DRAFT_27151 [Trichoderma asperellum CBS 433.97]PTB40574.1 hypothetical protein M441DRAFT_27151 [Trichoderma asperellum CBS 433.97]UKZ90756.1 hypothetical protein TrAFT101_005754 [Trichoderma asperellum]